MTIAAIVQGRQTTSTGNTPPAIWRIDRRSTTKSRITRINGKTIADGLESIANPAAASTTRYRSVRSRPVRRRFDKCQVLPDRDQHKQAAENIFQARDPRDRLDLNGVNREKQRAKAGGKIMAKHSAKNRKDDQRRQSRESGGSPHEKAPDQAEDERQSRRRAR